MFRKLLIFFALMLAVQPFYAADVDVEVYIYRDSTIFNYVFNLDESDSVSKFAVEKPADAQIDYVIDKNGVVEFDEAGDYYIINPEISSNNSVYLKFTSKQVSRDVFETDSYRNYVNFNFEAESLDYEIIFKEDLGEIINIFPQSYQVFNNDKIRWVVTNVSGEKLFIVNFKDASEAINESSWDLSTITLIVIPSILLLVSILVIFRKYKELDKIQEKLIRSSKKKEVVVNPEKVDEQELSQAEESEGESFEDIINKHLTENEKDVVLLVRNNEGISQYDILNYLPKLTKSNLSKIISKLHSKKILKRIKVGKVNNIYLGESLKSVKED